MIILFHAWLEGTEQTETAVEGEQPAEGEQLAEGEGGEKAEEGEKPEGETAEEGEKPAETEGEDGAPKAEGQHYYFFLSFGYLWIFMCCSVLRKKFSLEFNLMSF